MRHGEVSTREVKLALFCGAAVLALTASEAAAQAPVATAPPAAAERGPDGLRPDGAALESDLMIEDRAARTWTARGDVEARYQGRTVRAQEVTYQTVTGVVTARGAVQLIDTDGSVTYADEVQLDEDFRAGVALGFATRQPGNVTIAAASAVSRSENLRELNRTIYTACNLCTPEGRAKTPTWSIQAERVTQDRERALVSYRNAVFKVGDVPVFYTPVFWHPDPSVERRSGFLVPEVGASDRLGLSYEQPYLWVISPYQDLVISPMINSRVNPFLNLEYRKRFYSGHVEARLGYTHEQDFNEDIKFGEATSRSYVLANGAFQLGRDWRWGFSAERTSDDLLFDKYRIGDVYETRGLYEPDNRRLLSQLYVIRQDERSYFSTAALSFQGLRAGDDDRTFPIVAPLSEGRYEFDRPIAGGRLRALAHSAFLQRDRGPDSRRVTGALDWRSAVTLTSGVRFEPFVLARGDVYQVRDFGPASDDYRTRGYGTLGVDVSWPFIRPTGPGSVVLEPLLQVALSNESDRDSLIPNEDSVSFEFDETTLFEPNKFPGFDRFEGGLRANVGGRATFDWGAGRSASLLVGRSFRAEEDTVFPQRTGLRRTASDWIVAATVTPLNGVSLASRARLDSETLQVQRSETRLNVSLSRASLSAGHLYDVLDATGRAREDLDVFARVRLTRRIGVSAYGVRDQADGVWRRRDLGVFYQDECLLFEVVWEREETINRTLGPSDSVQVRVALATFGQGLNTREAFDRQR
jgi:LPS-assembly protein